MANKKVISFPHMGNYHIPLMDVGRMLDAEIRVAPPITKKTLEIGSLHSPEFVCVPFKYNIGNFIETLDNGANIIVQAGGGCRFGYYGEVQKQILKDLGYKFEFYNLSNGTNAISMYKDFKKINPNLTLPAYIMGFFRLYLKAKSIEGLEDYTRKNIGFEKKEGDFDRAEKHFLKDIKQKNTILGIILNHLRHSRIYKSIPIEKPDNLIRVGLVGELYVVMEPFSNYFMEKELAKKGIEVHRFITASYLLFRNYYIPNHEKHLLHLAKPYLKYHIGADGTDSVAMANKLMKDGFDGVIHLKPFGCMPEVNAMAALQRLSKENKFPILYFSFDSQTSETGIKTRIEAFHDMLSMRAKRTDEL